MWLLLLVVVVAPYVALNFFLIRYSTLPNPSLDQDASSSSSAAAPPPSASGDRPQILHPTKYDVFISFRGADVRYDFLDHLYHHLNNVKRLDVYKDDVDLPRGAEITPSLMEAIQISDVYVAILSRNYASSQWCLEELEKIFECVERHGRKFIPVTYDMSFNDFYGTLPSSSSSTAAAGNWRAKLEEIAGRAGLDYMEIRPETALFKEITRAVFQAIRGGGGGSSSELVTFSSYSASRGLVGIQSKVEQVGRLMCYDERANWTIGLWGMAGIGKTTLAQAFYHTFSSQFQASCFVSNFAGLLTSGRPSPQPFSDLQSAFFSKLLGDDDGGGGGAGTQSYDLTLRRVGRTKALVVIDDVDSNMANIRTLKDLFNGQYSDLFGPGSVVILTGTIRQLLNSVCHDVYHVNGVTDPESWRLFCQHAFKGREVNNAPPDDYRELTKRALGYAGGNPSALILLGAHLYGRDLEFWDGELGYLHDEDPKSVLESIGRRSYEGLSRAEKDLFLDLACFYPYWSRKELSRAGAVKDGRRNLVTNLEDKALISVDHAGCVEMKLVLRDLGRSIVNEEGRARKRTRLWKLEDASLLFKKPKDAQSIEGIVLDDDWWAGFIERPHGIRVPADAFEEMEDLRFLAFGINACNLILPEDGLNCLPNMLRILEWDSFPSRCLPSEFSAENLVTLGLTRSKIEQLWTGDELNVDLGNLKTLDLKGSMSLRKLPDLSTAKRLEIMHLSGCVSLEELPTSVLDLSKLETLNVSGCNSLKWDNLEDYVNGSPELSTRHSDILPNLKFVDLTITPIQMIPSFITHSSVLALDCADCTKLTKFEVIPSMERLDLTYSLIEEVVELEKMKKLKHLNLSQNKHLILISGDFSESGSLEMINLESCTKLSRLPNSIGNLAHLTSLDLSCTALEEFPSSIGDLTRLSELLFTGCKSLVCLPDTIHKLSNLKILKLDLCYQLVHLPKLPSSLKDLDVHGCKSLKTMSTEIAEAQLTFLVSEYTHWCFGWCWKLDPIVCSNIVDKFTQDLVRCPTSSDLLVPAKWVSNSSGEEGSITGSSYKSRATTKLLGQPWKLKSLFFCILMDTVPLNKLRDSNIDCFLISNDDDNNVTLEMKTHTPYRLPRRKYKDEEEEDEEDEEELLSNDHFFLWSADSYTDTVSAVQRVAETAADGDGAIVEFSFRGRYSSEEEGTETSMLIKNCRVIPVYEDRVVTYEEEEEEEEDDGDQYPVNLRGLYYQMCSGQ